jgi:hypothetical protein
MTDEKDYEVTNGLWIGSKYGDLRRERAKLMKQLIHDEDTSVKDKIRNLTAQIRDELAAKKIELGKS